VTPHLILDCYLDDVGGARNLAPHFEGRPFEVVRPAHEGAPVDARGHASLVVTGSAASVLDEPPWLAGLEGCVRDAVARGVPVLGVCFGHQVLARALFGPAAVRRADEVELGWLPIEVTARDPLLAGLPRRFRTFVSHADEVDPGLECFRAGARVLARSERCAVQAFRAVEPERPAWGVQFHAEMPLEESRALVRSRLGSSPEGRTSAEALLAAATDSRHLVRALLASFLAAADAGAPRPA